MIGISTLPELFQEYMRKIIMTVNATIYETQLCGHNKNLKTTIRRAMANLALLGFGTHVRTKAKCTAFKFIKAKIDVLECPRCRENLRELNIPFRIAYALYVVDYDENEE